MGDSIQVVSRSLKENGEVEALAAFTESVKVARAHVGTHGVLLPERLQPIDAIGAHCFDMESTRRALDKELQRIVPDPRQRVALDDLVNACLVAECNTYYWYGVSVGFVYDSFGSELEHFERILDRLLSMAREELQRRLAAHRARARANPKRRGPKPKAGKAKP